MSTAYNKFEATYTVKELDSLTVYLLREGPKCDGYNHFTNECTPSARARLTKEWTELFPVEVYNKIKLREISEFVPAETSGTLEPYLDMTVEEACKLEDFRIVFIKAAVADRTLRRVKDYLMKKRQEEWTNEWTVMKVGKYKDKPMTELFELIDSGDKEAKNWYAWTLNDKFAEKYPGFQKARATYNQEKKRKLVDTIDGGTTKRHCVELLD